MTRLAHVRGLKVGVALIAIAVMFAFMVSTVPVTASVLVEPMVGSGVVSVVAQPVASQLTMAGSGVLLPFFDNGSSTLATRGRTGQVVYISDTSMLLLEVNGLAVQKFNERWNLEVLHRSASGSLVVFATPCDRRSGYFTTTGATLAPSGTAGFHRLQDSAGFALILVPRVSDLRMALAQLPVPRSGWGRLGAFIGITG